MVSSGVGTAALAAAQEYAGQLAVGVAKDLETLREDLSKTLRLAGTDSAGDQEGNPALPVASEMPTPQFSQPPEASSWEPMLLALSAWFGTWMLRSHLGKRFGTWLAEAFDRYIYELRGWRSETLAEWRRAYSVSMELYLAAAGHGAEAADLTQVKRDLERLQAFEKESAKPG